MCENNMLPGGSQYSFKLSLNIWKWSQVLFVYLFKDKKIGNRRKETCNVIEAESKLELRIPVSRPRKQPLQVLQFSVSFAYPC